MTSILLVIHLLIALALVGTILLQRSEGGALSGLGGGGGGGGGGGLGGLMTARGSANLLTRTTAILAACFILTSLTLAIIAARGGGPSSILDEPAATPAAPSAPAVPTTPAAPQPPAEPSAPMAQ